MKRKILVVFLIISFAVSAFSGYRLLNWKLDSIKTNKQIDKINENVEIKEVKDNEDTKIIESEEKLDENNPYWKYIKMNLVDVDFTELKKINKDTKGWITLNGTNINYPFVQTKNNEYYLTRSFDKSYTDAGWVFLDYRNNINDLDKNNIIYAHARKDKTMFGTLRYTLGKTWYKNDDNHIIKLSTETNNSLWQVFSVYLIPSTNDYIQVKFINDDEFLKFIDKITKRSKYNFKTKVGKNDKILTLSTCYTNNQKVVLHAKLIKINKK